MCVRWLANQFRMQLDLQIPVPALHESYTVVHSYLLFGPFSETKSWNNSPLTIMLAPALFPEAIPLILYQAIIHGLTNFFTSIWHAQTNSILPRFHFYIWDISVIDQSTGHKTYVFSLSSSIPWCLGNIPSDLVKHDPNVWPTAQNTGMKESICLPLVANQVQVSQLKLKLSL